MDTVLVLVQGYVRKTSAGELAASPSTVLVKSRDIFLLVDPGANQSFLLKALADHGLSMENINMVFLTHYHPDHFLNIRLFPGRDVYDGTTVYRDDKETAYSQKIPSTDIQVIATPGHTPEHASLLIDAPDGKYAVSGDVFWWEDGQEPSTDWNTLLGLPDPLAQDMEALRTSRRKLLEMADYIIPGHGSIFKTGR
ncbi:MAG: MBL fold metallo-hydrolase [Dehalococcoidales bacterium]|nr:MBL fold metallo-hydrolase [Dehalococcoidales bacterium]